MPKKMKEARAFKDEKLGIRAEIHDVPIPSPTADQILIKVIVAGTNPKDWKIPVLVPQLNGTNSGDDVAGTVHSVGSNVTEFKPGDRVAGFHVMTTASGAFAEYAIVPASTTFHIPEKTSYEEAATIPLAALTAAVGLYARLGLPEPWNKVHAAKEALKGGIVVYGAASAVGAFVIKLLVRADIHPIISIAGNGIPFVKGLIDEGKGDVVIDYRKGDEAVVEGIKNSLPPGRKLMYAYDAVSEKGSYQNICQVLASDGHITLVLPGKKYEEIPKSVNQSTTTVGAVHGTPDDLRDLGFAWSRLFGQGLKEGWFSGHPHEVVPGGLGGVGTGLKNLMDGKASAIKYVYRIADTEGVERSKI